jgi:hypothetical protein
MGNRSKGAWPTHSSPTEKYFKTKSMCQEPSSSKLFLQFIELDRVNGLSHSFFYIYFLIFLDPELDDQLYQL